MKWHLSLSAALSLSILIVPAGHALGEVRVTDATLSANVVDRNPQGVSNRFTVAAGRIYCFTRVEGMEKGEIVHRWIHEGKVQTEIRLAVNGTSWRVWSAKNVYPDGVGEWKVEVIEPAAGKVLKILEFTLIP
jgi:hypothetical protein